MKLDRILEPVLFLLLLFHELYPVKLIWVDQEWEEIDELINLSDVQLSYESNQSLFNLCKDLIVNSFTLLVFLFLLFNHRSLFSQLDYLAVPHDLLDLQVLCKCVIQILQPKEYSDGIDPVNHLENFGFVRKHLVDRREMLRWLQLVWERLRKFHKKFLSTDIFLKVLMDSLEVSELLLFDGYKKVF